MPPPSSVYVCINDENGVYTWKLSNGNRPRIVVNSDNGVVVTVKSQDESIVYTKTISGTQVIFVIEDLGGTWNVSATNGVKTLTSTVETTEIEDYVVNFTFVDRTLNNNTWAEIADVSNNNAGSNYWAIGDAKSITFSNKYVGDYCVLNGTWWAVLIAFNHEYEEGLQSDKRIYFQLGRTAQSYSTTNSIAFVDSLYTQLIYNYRQNGFEIGSHGTDAWENCTMRTNILGQNLSSIPAHSFMNALPSDLRSLLKPYTSRFGTDFYPTRGVTDYIWLLGIVEITGGESYVEGTENSTTHIYEYYAQGNTRGRYKHDATSNYAKYWTRSSHKNSDGHSFFRIDDNRNVATASSAYSFGIAPCFCI